MMAAGEMTTGREMMPSLEMMPGGRIPGFFESLPKLRGRIRADAALAPFAWFRVGGTAEVLIRPADADDLAAFLRDLPHEIPVHVIGACSNLIVRDGGLPGVTIRLARGFSTVTPEAGGIVAGAAALDVTVAEHAAAAGLTGLEFLSGIPGSIGGAVAMNAGAYGGDVATVLDWAEIVTRTGEQRRLLGPQLAFAYRHAALPAGAVVTRVCLRAIQGAPALIAARMAEIKATREASQPVRARTGGSTFRNPDGMKAWELIDNAGCRGLIRGGAVVSEQHCNFLINTGSATAADIEGLGEEVRRRVQAATGVTLDWEIRRIGVPGGKPEVVPAGAREGVVPAGAREGVVPAGAREDTP
ncbi:MAG: UDP-N-acetylmuramate dehydrogenase [Acetobacteraceae bacterium]|nr:UDP-N-acetylmuramate dehydrogenase [Acetobacteraceae bacterium]